MGIKNAAKKTIAYAKRNGAKAAFFAAFERVSDTLNEKYDYIPLSEEVLEEQKREYKSLAESGGAMRFSIVVPLFNTPEKYLKEMIDSVVAQTYGNWELVLADASLSESETVKEYTRVDPRIKYYHLGSNDGISENTNKAIEKAKANIDSLFNKKIAKGKMTEEGKAEIWLGVFFTVFGILLLALIIPSQIKYVEGGYPQPRFFPDLISAIGVVLGISLLIQGIRKTRKDSEDQETYTFKWKETRLVLITLGIIILYVASMYFIPYLPATIVATGVLVALYGQRKIWKIILTAVLVPVIIYVGMTYGLMIRLP